MSIIACFATNEQFCSFHVTSCIIDKISRSTSKGHYRAVCPVPIRPIRGFVFSKEPPRTFQYRETWHRQFQTAVVPKAVGRRSFARQQPHASYTQQDCLSVMLNMQTYNYNAFCKPKTQQFISKLFHDGVE